MAEKGEKKKKLKGFAGVIAKNLEPLNSNQRFKEKYKDADTKILLNTKDGPVACLIKIKNGTIEFEAIENTPKENISKKALGWDGFLSTTTPIFMDLAAGKISTGGMLKKMLTGKIKIKNSKIVMALGDLFAILEGKEDAKNE